MLMKSRNKKNNKLKYYLTVVLREMIPSFLLRKKLLHKLTAIEQFDRKYVLSRVNYYNKLSNNIPLTEGGVLLKNYKIPTKARVYYFDSYEYLRFFPTHFRFAIKPGDIVTIPQQPSIVKSRPIIGENENSIILNLDKVRHFLFVTDSVPHKLKQNKLMWRGNVHHYQSHRTRFVSKFSDHPLCNVGMVNSDMKNKPQWLKEKLTMDEQLAYKFLLCIEGNDVATNLKWVMSSNSIAVMPKPKFETWFMEGTLIANHHYIEIKDDYSDLEEKITYYSTHTDKAQQIVENAHNYIQRFKNKEQENLIALMVLDKYFKKTKQS